MIQVLSFFDKWNVQCTSNILDSFNSITQLIQDMSPTRSSKWAQKTGKGEKRLKLWKINLWPFKNTIHHSTGFNSTAPWKSHTSHHVHSCAEDKDTQDSTPDERYHGEQDTGLPTPPLHQRWVHSELHELGIAIHAPNLGSLQWLFLIFLRFSLNFFFLNRKTR